LKGTASGKPQSRKPRPGGPALIDVPAHITGTVWKIEKKPGDPVSAGDVLVILESMKMEMPVEAPEDGKVSEVRCKEGQPVSEGEVLVVLAK